MDEEIKSFIESAVSAHLGTVTRALPVPLQGPGAALAKCAEDFALSALEYYALHTVASKIPSTAAAIKAAFPNLGL